MRVADAEMVRALRVMTIERGVDPRGYALLAFGGAGGLHAAAIADELGIDRILAPRASGVLSALGLAVAERRGDARRSVLLAGSALTREALAADTAELAGEARAALGADGDGLRVALDVRYRGQSFELTVEATERPDPAAVREAFEARHEERYGYREPGGDIEVVTARVSAFTTGPEVRLDAEQGACEPDGRREVVIGGAAVAATIWHGELAAGAKVRGPAVWQGPESTLLVPEGWAGAVDETATLVLERTR